MIFLLRGNLHSWPASRKNQGNPLKSYHGLSVPHRLTRSLGVGGGVGTGSYHYTYNGYGSGTGYRTTEIRRVVNGVARTYYFGIDGRCNTVYHRDDGFGSGCSIVVDGGAGGDGKG